MSRESLSGKTVLITGAARGIGAAVARLMHYRGARVALVDIDLQACDALRQELDSARVISLQADVCNLADMQKAAEQTRTLLGPIDVLVANAGIASFGTVAEGDPEVFRRTFDVNVMGVANSIRASAEQLIARRGYVLTVASVAALVQGPCIGAYAASKAAADALTGSLRIELADRGVDVGCAYFGMINTDMLRGSRRHPTTACLEELTPGFVNSEVEAEAAARAIVGGVETRARRILAPRWARATFVLRGLSQSLSERFYLHQVRSRPEIVRRAMRYADEAHPQQDHRLGTSAQATGVVALQEKTA